MINLKLSVIDFWAVILSLMTIYKDICPYFLSFSFLKSVLIESNYWANFQ